ncbi:dr1-associated corepressor homolog isoform X2 [Fundulus heteroclitus]|uniref:dr1-associated corepressor homolog isoform X2 n=1 Tax=Fundulus heteroclitus TaxID=8078 RepID=UPI00165ADFF4|nr:dr1-associated corepressor homolog isoform X2 [Fundulus heteroclitus]
MDMFAGLIADKVGDMVEGAVKNALGVDDKKEEKKGGFRSIFKGDNDEEKEEKGGFFSFGHDDKKKKDEEEDKGFFSKIFHKDDDEDKGTQKKKGFHGLFAEGPGGMGGPGGGEEAGGLPDRTVAVSDRDLFDDLMDVAEETSKN